MNIYSERSHYNFKNVAVKTYDNGMVGHLLQAVNC